MLFVMTRVLKVPATNPVVWQLSLTDRELDDVLRCSTLPQHLLLRRDQLLSAAAAGKAAAAEDEAAAGAVARKAVTDEDPCPICYEEMGECDLDMLVWCRTGCGKNVRCVRSKANGGERAARHAGC